MTYFVDRQGLGLLQLIVCIERFLCTVHTRRKLLVNSNNILPKLGTLYTANSTSKIYTHIRYVGLMCSLFIIEHLYLSGTRHGLYL